MRLTDIRGRLERNMLANFGVCAQSVRVALHLIVAPGQGASAPCQRPAAQRCCKGLKPLVPRAGEKQPLFLARQE